MSLKLIAGLSLLLGLTFCSDDATNPEGTANVTLVSEMPATSFSKAFTKVGKTEESTADKINGIVLDPTDTKKPPRS